MATRNPIKKPVEQSADLMSPYVGPLLLEAREKIGMKQEVLAKKTHMSDAKLRKIESGMGPLRKSDLELICKVLDLNQDVILLKANTSMRASLLEKLGCDPTLSIFDQQEQRRAAAKARHEAELKELETELSWDRLVYLTK